MEEVDSGGPVPLPYIMKSLAPPIAIPEYQYDSSTIRSSAMSVHMCIVGAIGVSLVMEFDRMEKGEL